MSTQTKPFKVTPAQYQALLGKVQQEFGSDQVRINGNAVSAGPVDDVLLEAVYDGESNLVVSLTGPWLNDKIGMGKIRDFVNAVCSPSS